MIRAGSVRIERVVKQHGRVTVLHGIDLAIEGGEFFVLLGPSGSGKTTTLRILAGLESVQSGKVWMDGVDVTMKEPGERDVAMVFQSYALYPHMTVAENIAFPLRMVGTRPDTIREAVAAAAARVDISHLLDRRPGALSGGQQQRCALARAIVRQPRLFLLDEPLSNLDAKLRIETRVELRKLQRSLGVTAVYVTHDQEEAMTLADRVAVFMDGRIVQVGSPKEIYQKPASVAVAGFIGTPPMNLMPALWHDDSLQLAGANITLTSRSPAPREVLAGIRPSELRIAGEGIPARVELVEELGDARVVDLLVGEQRVKLKTEQGQRLAEGEDVKLAFSPESVHLFDRQTGARLRGETA